MPFIPLSQYASTRTATQAPAASQPPQPTTPGQSGVDSDLGRAIAVGRFVTTLSGITDQLTPGSWGSLTAGANTLLSAAQAYRNFSQGRNTQGALNTAATVGSGLRLGSQYLPASLAQYAPAIGAAGSALGGVTGLAGAGLALSQGDVRGGIQGLVGGAGSLASLAPAAWTIGGVPIASSAGGILGTGIGAGTAAAAPAAAATTSAVGVGGGATVAAAGAGTGAAGGAAAGATAGASIAGALGAIGLVMAVGFAVEHIVNAALGEGPYGKTPLPFGRGTGFSSADNLASQKSKFIGIQGANVLGGSIQGAPKDPGWILGLAGAGSGLSPHGEVQFSSKFGHGGDWDDPQSPEFTESLRRAEAGDIPTIRDLLSTMEIRTGEGGATGVNPKLTETWRAKLLYSLPPETQRALGRDLNSLMGPVSKDNMDAMFYRSQILNPPRDGSIRFGAVKLPMNHEYMRYDTDTTPPSYKPIGVDQVAISLAPAAHQQVVGGKTWGRNPTLVYDKTTGKGLSVNLESTYDTPDGGIRQTFQINPEYLDTTKYGKERTASTAEQDRRAALRAAEAAQRSRDNAAWAAGPGSM